MNFKKFFRESEERIAQLSEVSQSTSTLESFLNSPEASEMMFGFEAEVVITDFDEEYAEPELVDKYVRRNIDISDLTEFFGNHNSRQLKMLNNEFEEYVYEKEQEFVDLTIDNELEDRKQYLYDKLSPEEQEESSPDDFEKEATSELEAEAEQDFDAPSLYDFLTDNLLDTYLDIARVYDLDLDALYPEQGGINDTTGYSLDRAKETAENIAYVLDIDIEAFEGYHQGSGSEKWRIEPDSSLSPRNPNTECAMEIITPDGGLPLKEGIEKMMELFAWLKDNGGYTSSSATTGLHINLSFPGQERTNVDYVKLVLFSGDDYVLDQFGRIGGYNRQSSEDIKQAINSGDIETALNLMRKGLATAASTSLIASNKSRTVTVNMKDNYVEFRVVGNNYLKMGDEVRFSVLRFARALIIASDPESHKEEYAKKLYKLISQQHSDSLFGGVSSAETVQLFANILSQLKFGPPSALTRNKILLLKKKMNSLRQKLELDRGDRETNKARLPDASGASDTRIYAEEAKLNAKALKLIIKYQRDEYGIVSPPELEEYVAILDSGDKDKITKAFAERYAEYNKVQSINRMSSLLAFTPLSSIQDVKPELLGTQTPLPYMVELSQRSKRLYLKNVILNYS